MSVQIQTPFFLWVSLEFCEDVTFEFWFATCGFEA